MARSLKVYEGKRDFKISPEPASSQPSKPGALPPNALRFVVQHHLASRDHFDLRLEHDGTMLSWAVTKGPSANPKTKRLAVRTEDHPIAYNDFEGVIPEKQYGAGPVMIWDRGTWGLEGKGVDEGLRNGQLKFTLAGERMRGSWALVRLADAKRENWLLIKHRDGFAEDDDTLAVRFKTSVVSQRNFSSIVRGDAAKPQKKLAAPDFIPPMLCDTARAPPQGDEWQFEMKYDGYRLQLAFGKGSAILRTRNGHDWSDRFPAILNAAKSVSLPATVIDGEAVVFDKTGVAHFPSLVEALGKGGAAITFVAFDVMLLRGRDMTPEPLGVRRAELEKLMRQCFDQSFAIRLAPAFDGPGDELLKQIAEAGGEGIIAKRISSKYLSRRSPSWQKIKAVLREDAVVVGYMPSPAGRKFASLLLAVKDKRGLRYAGRAGTGYSARIEADVFERLLPLKRKLPPAGVEGLAIAPRQAQWVEPRLTIAIAYNGYTGDGQFRSARFLGWRDDAAIKPVAKAALAKAGKPVKVVITHPERVIFPEINFTKGDAARYYERVAGRMMEHLRDRPVSLLRAPDGLDDETFFQRHPMPAMKHGIERVRARGSDKGEYFAIADRGGLLTCVQFGAIEFHGWGAVVPDLDHPDRMIFDLDPDESVPFSAVRDGALLIKKILDHAGLLNFPLVSGGKGIHVVVPLGATQPWPVVEAFSSAIARILAAAEPTKFVAVMSKARRRGKIYVDYLRNKKSATAIVPYSLRAKAGASVAMPITWRRLPKIETAGEFTALDLALTGKDPWPQFFDSRQNIGSAALAVVARFNR